MILKENFVTYLAWSDSIELQKPHQLQPVSVSEIKKDVPRKRTTELRCIRHCRVQGIQNLAHYGSTSFSLPVIIITYILS